MGCRGNAPCLFGQAAQQRRQLLFRLDAGAAAEGIAADRRRRGLGRLVRLEEPRIDLLAARQRAGRRTRTVGHARRGGAAGVAFARFAGAAAAVAVFTRLAAFTPFARFARRAGRGRAIALAAARRTALAALVATAA